MTLRRKLEHQDATGDPQHGELSGQPFDVSGIDQPRQQPDLTYVADHVKTVLAAAEAAADKLRFDAEQDAQRIRDEATRSADDAREHAATEAEAERAEARRQLTHAKEEARATQTEADAYAESRRREADAEAMRLVRDAERRSSQIAAVAAERHGILLNDIAASEGRMRELAVSLREVAQRLDDVAGSTVGEVELDRTLMDEAGASVHAETAA